MKPIKYQPWEIENFEITDEGRKYLEYNSKVGGEPLGLMIPFGYPAEFDKYGSVIAVYDECIKKGITWEKLLKFNPPKDALL